MNNHEPGKPAGSTRATTPLPRPAWPQSWPSVLSLVAAAAVSFSATSAGSSDELPRDWCQGGPPSTRACTSTADCGLIGYICIRDDGSPTGGTCRPACAASEQSAGDGSNPGLCAYGEACITGEELGARETRYCKPVPFTMDLNLLDSCIYYFVEGLVPTGASSDNVCSTAYNLAQMLDRDGTSGFTIYDFDLCIQEFLGQEPAQPCGDGSCLYCTSDDDCGAGSFCEPTLNRCERECGRIAERGEDGVEAIERTCSGRMKVCNEQRGRCDDYVGGGQACITFEDCPRGGACLQGVCEIVPAQCEVDRDCPNGAYCFLGECQPRCFRSLECPDSNWFCSEERTCERRPAPGQPEGFEPSRYSVLFGLQALKVDNINDRQELPILIMDTDSGRAVFGDPNVLFGYRLQVTYGRKQDPACLGDLDRDELTDQQRADCVISPEEEFLTVENPFGTIYGDGRDGVDIMLNNAAAGSLTPGRYLATIRAVFSNGSSTSMTVVYDKPSPDGRYGGSLEVGVDDPKFNLLAVTQASLGLRIHMDEETTWDALLASNNLIDLESGDIDGREFQDVTFGYLVDGAIYGNGSLVFNNPNARSAAENEIAVRGLYSPQYRKLRLISVVDIAADAEWCRDGTCTASGDSFHQLRVDNVFGRKIRRKIEWLGEFDSVTRRYEGIYRETLSGLFPYVVTLQGDFKLAQTVQDPGLTFAHGSLTTPLLPQGGATSVGFPDLGRLFSDHTERVATLCQGVTSVNNDLAAAAQHFSEKAEFQTYMNDLDETPVFSSLQAFGGRVAGALDSAGGNIAEATVSIADALRDSVKRCSVDPDASVCTDVLALQCALALHAKALLAGEAVQDDAPVCDRSDQCNDTVCADDPSQGRGRCRTACDGPTPTLCTATEICKAGTSVDGEDGHFCEPAFAGWVDRAAVIEELTQGSGANTSVEQAALFCDRRAMQPDDNCEPAAQTPNVSALQEYVWFYRELHQMLAFEAGQDVSDAFFQLYRDEYLNDNLGMTKAFRDKVQYLKSAIGHYDEARDQMFDPVTAQVLFDWPMAHFDTQGVAWLQQMHSVLNDRAETLYELVDLQRRIMRDDMSNDELFYNHVFQQEYLSQVFLAVLQGHWQGPQFAYAGQGPKALGAADRILRRVSEVNNPLGLRPNRTYFENGAGSGADTNIELFRQRAAEKLVRLIGGDDSVGFIAETKATLQQSIASEQQLIDDLDTLKDQLDEELLRLCGEDRALPQGCADLAGLDRTLQSSCSGPDCPVTFQCEDSRCERVGRLFSDTLDSTLEEVACRADTPLLRIYKNPPPNENTTQSGLSYYLQEEDLESRLCVRGEVGSLLQERASLELSRQDTLRQANDMMRQLAIKAELIASIGSGYDNLETFLLAHKAVMKGIEAAWGTAQGAHGVSEAAAYGADCMTIIITGTGATGGGDNCKEKKALAFKMGAAAGELEAARQVHAIATTEADIAKTIELNGFEETSQINRIKAEMDSLMSQLDGLIGQYQMVIQQMHAVDIRTADTLAVAQSRWNSYNDSVERVAERLTGQDSRWALLRNSASMSAQREFRGLLLNLYKLVQAISYRFDLPEGVAVALRNQVYQLVTVGQVKAFLAEIDCSLEEFAGANNLGPFWGSLDNAQTFVMSLREQLFPTLTDIVDPDTGRTLTAGEQFHRIITSPPYLRRVATSGGNLEQRIIIPFATWMDVRTDSLVGQPALLGGNGCNHVVVGDATHASVALNFEVWHPRPDQQGKEVVHGWLGRGTIDHMRSCSDTYPVSGTPVVRSYTFGNAYRDSAVPLPNTEEYFEACVGRRVDLVSSTGSVQDGLTCWKTAFVERTLGSPDWTLEIDSLSGNEDNWWILHSPSDQPDKASIITDIDVVFRYELRRTSTEDVTFQCTQP